MSIVNLNNSLGIIAPSLNLLPYWVFRSNDCLISRICKYILLLFQSFRQDIPHIAHLDPLNICWLTRQQMENIPAEQFKFLNATQLSVLRQFHSEIYNNNLNSTVVAHYQAFRSLPLLSDEQYRELDMRDFDEAFISAIKEESGFWSRIQANHMPIFTANTLQIINHISLETLQQIHNENLHLVIIAYYQTNSCLPTLRDEQYQELDMRDFDEAFISAIKEESGFWSRILADHMPIFTANTLQIINHISSETLQQIYPENFQEVADLLLPITKVGNPSFIFTGEHCYNNYCDSPNLFASHCLSRKQLEAIFNMISRDEIYGVKIFTELLNCYECLKNSSLAHHSFILEYTQFLQTSFYDFSRSNFDLIFKDRALLNRMARGNASLWIQGESLIKDLDIGIVAKYCVFSNFFENPTQLKSQEINELKAYVKNIQIEADLSNAHRFFWNTYKLGIHVNDFTAEQFAILLEVLPGCQNPYLKQISQYYPHIEQLEVVKRLSIQQQQDLKDLIVFFYRDFICGVDQLGYKTIEDLIALPDEELKQLSVFEMGFHNLFSIAVGQESEPFFKKLTKSQVEKILTLCIENSRAYADYLPQTILAVIFNHHIESIPDLRDDLRFYFWNNCSLDSQGRRPWFRPDLIHRIPVDKISLIQNDFIACSRVFIYLSKCQVQAIDIKKIQEGDLGEFIAKININEWSSEQIKSFSISNTIQLGEALKLSRRYAELSQCAQGKLAEKLNVEKELASRAGFVFKEEHIKEVVNANILPVRQRKTKKG